MTGSGWVTVLDPPLALCVCAVQNTYTFPRDAFIRPEAIKPVPFGMPQRKADSFPEK